MDSTLNTAIDDILQAEIKPNGTGAAVAVAQNGEIVHANGYGLANIEWNIPITTDTVFRLASITKQFTAVAIMMLAEQGKLSVDDEITKFFPDYPTSGHTITVHHLLTHTSGIFSYTSAPDFPVKMAQDVTPQQLYDEFSRIPFDFKPGDKYLYNNSAYILLGMIIEKCSGQSYADFVEQHIFAPLGMKQSYYLDNVRIIPKRASGYAPAVPDGDSVINAPYLSMTQPHAAGALGSTVLDLVLWNKALDENKLISAETLAKMHTSAKLNDGSETGYGYGWGIHEYQGHRVVHHAGGINGFNTFGARFSDDGLTIIVLANRAPFDVYKVTATIARRIFGIPDVLREPIGLSGDFLQRCVGQYKWNGFPIETQLSDDGKLILNLGRPIHLLPLSETEFYDAADPEMTVSFGDLRDGQFYTLKTSAPFQSPTTAPRAD